MKKKTHQGPIGSVTQNPDGTIDLTIDPQKLHNTVVQQHENVLAGIKAAKASGLGAGMFPAGMLDELEKFAEAELVKTKARPVPTTTPGTLRFKGKKPRT